MNSNDKSTNEIDEEDSDDTDDIEVTATPPSSQIQPKKSKKKKVEEESDFVSKIMGSFECVADAMKECTKVLVISKLYMICIYKFVFDR